MRLDIALVDGPGAELALDDQRRLGERAVRVALFDSAEHFLKRALRSAGAPAVEGTTTLIVSGLAAGDYAIAVYHDANDNGKLDQNMMGIPVEATAFSNDALGNMGPPSFEAVRFALPAGGKAIRVTLR